MNKSRVVLKKRVAQRLRPARVVAASPPMPLSLRCSRRMSTQVIAGACFMWFACVCVRRIEGCWSLWSEGENRNGFTLVCTPCAIRLVVLVGICRIQTLFTRGKPAPALRTLHHGAFDLNCVCLLLRPRLYLNTSFSSHGRSCAQRFLGSS